MAAHADIDFDLPVDEYDAYDNVTRLVLYADPSPDDGDAFAWMLCYGCDAIFPLISGVTYCPDEAPSSAWDDDGVDSAALCPACDCDQRDCDGINYVTHMEEADRRLPKWMRENGYDLAGIDEQMEDAFHPSRLNAYKPLDHFQPGT